MWDRAKGTICSFFGHVGSDLRTQLPSSLTVRSQTSGFRTPCLSFPTSKTRIATVLPSSGCREDSMLKSQVSSEPGVGCVQGALYGVALPVPAGPPGVTGGGGIPGISPRLLPFVLSVTLRGEYVRPTAMQEQGRAQSGEDPHSHPDRPSSTIWLQALSPQLAEWASPHGGSMSQRLRELGLASVPPGHFFLSPCLSVSICTMASL